MKVRNHYFWTAAIVNITIDIISKRAIVENLRIERTSIAIIPNIFHFTYIRNHGAAFSMLEGQPWLAWLSLFVSITLILIGVFRTFSNIWEQLGFGLILAGAAGNGIDRLFFGGSVVDFIDLRIINFAIFNWADISINLGIFCLLVHSFIYQPRQSKPH
ncbi:signal peptidase II [Chamaesiphon sp. VAR_48_metabat_135_sub]|uniref:signal peptidase II n=1 Tax=Chamaesiphon sp. VAR_48_metabat_135_sub TaxID=2964699 RepID=UPI002869F736|nr:signal peptidase II [Chamaesiphon sp. VAR_48_metabat_135_sub]